MRSTMLAVCACAASAFQLPQKLELPKLELNKLAPAFAAAAVSLHSEAAHAKSVLGVNGALDFGPLAGDQPGGEGTGKVRIRLPRDRRAAGTISAPSGTPCAPRASAECLGMTLRCATTHLPAVSQQPARAWSLTPLPLAPSLCSVHRPSVSTMTRSSSSS